jgi:hypothetical protein
MICTRVNILNLPLSILQVESMRNDTLTHRSQWSRGLSSPILYIGIMGSNTTRDVVVCVL